MGREVPVFSKTWESLDDAIRVMNAPASVTRKCWNEACRMYPESPARWSSWLRRFRWVPRNLYLLCEEVFDKDRARSRARLTIALIDRKVNQAVGEEGKEPG